MAIGAVEATAAGTSEAATVLTGFGVVVPTFGVGIGLDEVAVGVSMAILDDWAVAGISGVSSCMGAALGLAGVLCVETPGEVTTDVEAALVETPWLSWESMPSVFVITDACGDCTPRT